MESASILECRVCSAYGKFRSRTCGKVAGTDCRINDWKCEPTVREGCRMPWSNALPQSCTTAARLLGCRVDIVACHIPACWQQCCLRCTCEFILTKPESVIRELMENAKIFKSNFCGLWVNHDGTEGSAECGNGAGQFDCNSIFSQQFKYALECGADTYF